MDRKTIASWCLYDFANSFYVVLPAVIWQIQFQRTIVGNATGLGDLWWGRIISASMLLVALSSPVMGAIADHAGVRKRLLYPRHFSLALPATTYLLDLAIDAISMKCSRWEDVDFSQPYYRAEQRVMVRNDSTILTTGDLNDARVCVTIGSTSSSIWHVCTAMQRWPTTFGVPPLTQPGAMLRLRNFWWRRPAKLSPG